VTSAGGTVVNLSTPHPKIKGLNPAAVADNRKKLMSKSLTIFINFQQKVLTFGATTLNITTLSMMTLSITIKNA
jgi:uncharacterized protein YpmS